MSLCAGFRLGPYQILGPLGAGGMGEVYRALDTRLDRKVALKVLPEAFASDSDRMARFEREAKVLASLNHPNIAAIYGVEERALVMELVEGETLKGPLPLETALDYARQIADALEAAHEKGIIHRDLKPGNVKVTPQGVVKVLDFGLAAVAQEQSPGGDALSSPTLTMHATQAGMIMGTAAYMSPEQASGKPVDKRADIWSFGAVLWEILTGKRLFEGETISHTLAAVLTQQPDLTALPARVRPLIERCLCKDPRKRWRDIGDVRVEIEAMLADPSGVIGQDEPPALRPKWKLAIPVLGATIIFSAFTGVVVWRFRTPAPPIITRFPVSVGEGQAFTNVGRLLLAFSPDGTQLVYVANRRLYLRSMSDSEARAIPGSEDARGVANPVFSPDGRSLAFWSSADATLKRIAVSGGSAVTICPADSPWGMTWASDGIIFGQGGKGIMRVSPNGGKPELIAKVKPGELAAFPQMLPDGKALLFTLASGSSDWDKAQIVVQELKSGARKTLIDAGSAAVYVPTGHIVYAVSGVLLAVPFDLRRLEVKGAPVPVVEGVARSSGTVTGVAQFSFSTKGSLAYVPGPVSVNLAQSTLVLVDHTGRAEPLKLPPAAYGYPRVSPDGKRVAYQTDDGKQAIIWIYDLSGTNAPQRLTFQGANRYPIWSSDGERVAFQSDREGDLGIFWRRADGNGEPERLTHPEKGVSQVPDSWSPDGRYLSFTAVQGDTSAVWTLSLRDRKTTLFASSPSSLVEASTFSPDGRWVAYDSTETGRTEIYIRPFPANTTKYEVQSGATNTGTHAFWSRDGRQLFFGSGPTTLAVVSITFGPSLTFSGSRPVPRGGLVAAANGPSQYDILPDGRFLGVAPASQVEGAVQIQVVLNWFEDLKQRVPVNK